MKFSRLDQPLFLPLLFFVIVCGCTKTDTINIPQPAACFTTMVSNPYYSQMDQGSTARIDSNFYFRNCSDSGSAITYQWNFGDGTSSKDKNPKHAYSKRGKYSVTLVVSNNDRAYDTARQDVSVILGQQDILFGTGLRAEPIDIVETAANEFVLLATTNYTTFHLVLLDSLLQKTSMKTFPSSFRLNSINATTDGNYLFAGSTQSADKANELIKMKADGTILWNKVFSSGDFYNYAVQTPDNGYIVVGSRKVPAPSGNINYITIVVKTDANGNKLWEKLFNNEGMIYSKDAVVEQDGIVVAGVKRRSENSPCYECDSLFIVKLSNQGNTVWESKVFWGLNTSNWSDTRITKLTNGNYAVSNQFTRGVFYYGPMGNLVDRKLAPYQILSVTSTSDGNLAALQLGYGNGQQMYITKLTLPGEQLWNVSPDGREKVSGGYSCCTSNWPGTIDLLRRGGILATGSRVSNNFNPGITSSIVLMQLDDEGKLK
jgi:PKD repeat protein